MNVFSALRAWITALVRWLSMQWRNARLQTGPAREVEMPSAWVTERLVSEAAARRARNQQLFEAIAFLDSTIDGIWLANQGRIRARGPAQRVLAVLFGKATKTLDGIRILCESGFGQDAIILTRSLVNLVINVWYIGSGSDPDERALDYNASGWKAWHKFLKDFPGRRDPPPDLPNPAEIDERAKRWDEVPILDKAKGSDLHDTYREVYRHGSSFDHSDSWSAGSYFAGSDGESIKIDNAPSDDLLIFALGYAFQAMLILTRVFCNAFGLAERERLEALRAEFLRIGTKSPDPA